MPRLLFSKTGDAVWSSHLDLMRTLMRSFRRAGIRLAHSQGFAPHPIFSIALPLSVGMSSDCELAEFSLEPDEDCPVPALAAKLEPVLPAGIHALQTYDGGQKLGALQWLDVALTLCYDRGVPDTAAREIGNLFSLLPTLEVEKHGKKGPVTVDIQPMHGPVVLQQTSETALTLRTLISAQNPTLNPALLVTAIETKLPEAAPDFSRCHRLRMLNAQLEPFF